MQSLVSRSPVSSGERFLRGSPMRSLRARRTGSASRARKRVPRQFSAAPVKPIGALVEGGVSADRASIHGVHSSRSEEHTSELQSRENLVCRLLLEKKKKT